LHHGSALQLVLLNGKGKHLNQRSVSNDGPAKRLLNTCVSQFLIESLDDVRLKANESIPPIVSDGLAVHGI